MDGTITQPAPGATALLIVDMINPFDFDEAQPLRDAARDASFAIATLRDAADAAGVPVIYVNDNGDRWHSDPNRLIDAVVRQGEEACEIAERLRPRPDDFFVIKPRFSGFYATNLQVLLPRPGGEPADPDRDRRRYLRAVHGSRRAHARLRLVGARRRGREP